MKYGMLYDNKSRHLNDFDEIILKYTHKTPALIEHIQKYKQEQRIIVDVQYLYEINNDASDSKEIFLAAADLHPNIAIMGVKEQIHELKEIGLPYFYANLVTSWDKLNEAIMYGVSDVYIGNEFAFSMIDIANYCQKHGIKIRVFANVAQTDASNLEDTICQFFIRPEDVVLYEDYVNVIEFFGPINRQDVLFEIYTSGKWIGNLAELISGLKEEVKNPFIAGCFGIIRRNCKKRCAYTSSCNICKRFVSITETTKEVHSEH